MAIGNIDSPPAGVFRPGPAAHHGPRRWRQHEPRM